MTALEILIDLRRAGALVTIAGDKLRLEAPKSVLTNELKQRLAAQKAEIIRLLQAEPDAYLEGPATNGQGRPPCSTCSKFRPIGMQGCCSGPADPNFSMAMLIVCTNFAMKTVH